MNKSVDFNQDFTKRKGKTWRENVLQGRIKDVITVGILAFVLFCVLKSFGISSEPVFIWKAERHFGLISGVSIYLLAAFLTKLKWGRFSCAVVGLSSSAAAIYLATRSLYKYSIAALIASWVISIAAALLWGRKNEEQ